MGRAAQGWNAPPSIAGRTLFASISVDAIIMTIMFACSYGVAFGAIQQMPQIVPGVDAVKQQIVAANDGKPEAEHSRNAARINQQNAAEYAKSQELGGLFGRFTFAVLATLAITRANLLRVFLIPGLFLMPLIFLAFARGNERTYFSTDISFIPGFHDLSVTLLGLGIFLAGFFTVAQFSFWGNYLPRVYPIHLRGTGESFAANIGGRMIGTCFAFFTQQLALLSFVPGTSAPQKVAYVAAGVATLLYFINLLLSFCLPKPVAESADGE
jgi:hypothetical protein